MENKIIKVFLLHFAGGSSYSFDFLKPFLPNCFEFIPLELPGRGKRIEEELIKNKEVAIEDYVRQIKLLHEGVPFMIFGHSMGADLGFYVTKRLEKSLLFPEYLFVSGNPGPKKETYDLVKEKSKKLRYKLSDDELKEELREIGGMPEEVLQDNDIFDFFKPIIRADFQVLEDDNTLSKNIVIKSPIYALMGKKEEHSSRIDNWKNYTSSSFNCSLFKGNHFFIYDHPENISAIIKEAFSNVLISNFD
ncbi:surfactin synthase thioesterase subunit [Tenacibaculum gallaicum]|uniref:Surfactin synthase thioesterase subunit n=1 Tax=Tenacibaculum gallaicum TaxID=561505 RepID=A0A3E0I8E8_9FLAO|nr:thioesterase domain-containing protein [Tenacibaculum gallaicum]REH54909.1 surfactin synthase thioesterase subunit [Tenacibaculum gallaicum]